MFIPKKLNGAALLIAAILVSNPLYADKVKDVNVVNTPMVDANQMGNWDVTVDNDATNPVPTEITNVEPIAVEIIGDNSNGQNGNNLGPKKPSDLVTLIGVSADCTGVTVRRVFPDATVEEPWLVPAESVLVVTGFDWHGRFGTPGEIVEIILTVFEPSVARAEGVFRDYARVGDNGAVGRSSPVQNAVFGPGTAVCTIMIGATDELATLRGFLAPDE